MITTDQEISQRSSAAVRFQIIVAAIIIAIFLFSQGQSAAGAALVGALFSIFLTWTVSWSVRKANEIAKIDPNRGMGVIYISAALRFFLLLVFFAVAIGVAKLSGVPILSAAILVWITGAIVPNFTQIKR